jgi:hypothetical protein
LGRFFRFGFSARFGFYIYILFTIFVFDLGSGRVKKKEKIWLQSWAAALAGG